MWRPVGFESGTQNIKSLIQIAFKESGRAKDIDETLNVLLMALHRIQLTHEFPRIEISQLETVKYAALSLCAAVMDYISVAIKILRKPVVGQHLFSDINFSEHDVQSDPWKQ